MKKRSIIFTLALGGIFALLLQNVASAQSARWEQMPGLALEIASGGGTVWCIGVDSGGAGGRKIYRWRNGAWKAYPGAGVRIAVDSNGTPWVVNAQHQIYRWSGGEGGQWNLMPGSANDIAAGGGAVWVIGTTATAGGYGVWKWDGGRWQSNPGAGVRIAVDGNGIPWVVNAQHQIWTWRPGEGAWHLQPGAANRIAASPGVWVTGIAPAAGGYQIWRWNGSNWDLFGNHGATSIAVGPAGNLWVTNEAHQIYRVYV